MLFRQQGFSPRLDKYDLNPVFKYMLNFKCAFFLPLIQRQSKPMVWNMPVRKELSKSPWKFPILNTALAGAVCNQT